MSLALYMKLRTDWRMMLCKMLHENNCAVSETWQNFIDECLIHVDTNVQVCSSSCPVYILC